MEDKSATRAAAEVAGRQHGVVSVGQLEAVGYGRRRVSRDCAAGRLHRIHQGVYAVGHRALTREGRCMAAVLTCGHGALLSRLSAAWLWGISTRYPAIPEVTTTVTVRHTRNEVRVHSATTLHPDDIATADGIPLTAVPRTLLDLAGGDSAHLRWALPRARRLGLLEMPAIDSMLARSAGLRGVRRLRRALDRYRRLEFTRSDLELRFLELVERAGLPRPSMNLFVCDYELDAYWAELRFAVELDTYDYHGDEVSFEQDRLRQEDLKLAGIEMIRITGRRMDREPAAIVARLRRLIDRRRSELN